MIRYVYCKKGYDVENKVHVLKEDLKEVSEEKKIKTLKTEIRIILEILEDAELQVALTKIYNENKSRGVQYLEFFIENLTMKNFNFIFSWEPSQ